MHFVPNKKGFTFIEAILTLLILSGGILGILALFQQNVSRFNESEVLLSASYLAQEKMEQIIHDKKRQGYNFVIIDNYLSPEDLDSEGYPGYSRTLTIEEVRDTDLITPQNGTGYKRITVSVTPPGYPAITLITLITSWGEI